MNILNVDQQATGQGNQEDRPYECHICLEIASEPVLTPCGHLFCWPCIYYWLNSNQEFLTCPVCKNGTASKSLIPLYSKSDDNSQQKKQRDPNIPQRPKPIRNEPVRNQNSFGNGVNTPNINNLNSGIMLAGYGLFPSLYNLNLVLYPDFVEDPFDANQTEYNLVPFLTKWLYTSIALFVLLILLFI